MHSRWDGVEKDSTFVFVPGEPEFYQEAELVGNNQKIYQFCFNRTGHETVEGPAAEQVLVEGGGGLKPVILASELQRKPHLQLQPGFCPEVYGSHHQHRPGFH